jgi:single-strand DNA-binding protein
MNHFMGIGRVGMVDSRKIKNDIVVTSVSVALNERYPDKDGKPVEKTTWVRVTCWRKLGEIAQQILHTGDLVAFTGKLEQPSVYKNQKGEYVASLELTGETIEKLSKKGEHEGNGQAATQTTANVPPSEMEEEAASIPMGSAPF